MIAFSDLPDPQKGRKMFEDFLGPKWGPRAYRATLWVLVPLIVLAVAVACLSQIGGFGKTMISSVKTWFPSAGLPVVPAQTPTPPVAKEVPDGTAKHPFVDPRLCPPGSFIVANNYAQGGRTLLSIPPDVKNICYVGNETHNQSGPDVEIRPR